MSEFDAEGNPSPWEKAMDAISAHGCDCDDAPDDLKDHRCVAGICEYALKEERKRAERAEGKLLAIAGAFNGWANGGDDLEAALQSIGRALGPPWPQ